jgi:hypothetical protein
LRCVTDYEIIISLTLTSKEEEEERTEEMIRATFVFSLLAASVSATCDNSCSGHGSCTCDNECVCQCYDNWGMGQAYDSGDCSDRICPFELAWVDAPDHGGIRHKYAECSGKGICNRINGECECFDGYEGKGCQRSSCPNDCSGHGTCEYLEDLHYAAVEFDYRHYEFTQEYLTFDYYGWDKTKIRACVCDPQYGDVDCSKRMCQYGSDMMDNRDDMTRGLLFQTQRIRFTVPTGDTLDELEAKTFALTFKSKLNETFTTIPIVFDTTAPIQIAQDIHDALLNLPNGVVDGVEVHCGFNDPGAIGDFTEFVANVTFTGVSNQGTQHLLTVEDFACGDGCYPKLTGVDLKPMTGNVTETWAADLNSYECGRRGKCDYDTGLCQCFEGFTGPSCGTCTSLI